MKARVTISKTYGHDRDTIEINIRDDSSRQTIVKVRMNMLEFAQCITGLSEQEADIIRVIEDANLIGKKRITKTIEIDPPETHIREERKKIILDTVNDLPEVEKDGWKLLNDGTTTKQGIKHKVTLCKYVEE